MLMKDCCQKNCHVISRPHCKHFRDSSWRCSANPFHCIPGTVSADCWRCSANPFRRIPGTLPVQTVGSAVPGGQAVPTHSAAILAHCRCRRLAVQCQVGRQCQPIPPQSWGTMPVQTVGGAVPTHSAAFLAHCQCIRLAVQCHARWACRANPFRRNPGTLPVQTVESAILEHMAMGGV